jgi:hypothetical protein
MSTCFIETKTFLVGLLLAEASAHLYKRLSNIRHKPLIKLVPRDKIFDARGDTMHQRFIRLGRAHKLPTLGFLDEILRKFNN